jgi:hypothetical protein
MNRWCQKWWSVTVEISLQKTMAWVWLTFSLLAHWDEASCHTVIYPHRGLCDWKLREAFSQQQQLAEALSSRVCEKLNSANNLLSELTAALAPGQESIWLFPMWHVDCSLMKKSEQEPLSYLIPTLLTYRHYNKCCHLKPQVLRVIYFPETNNLISWYSIPNIY